MNKLILILTLFYSTISMAKVEEFVTPRVEGLRMDACLYWAKDCEGVAAAKWCSIKGYEKAIYWDMDIGVGRKEPTKMLIDKKICSTEGCSAFATIVCYSKYP